MNGSTPRAESGRAPQVLGLLLATLSLASCATIRELHVDELEDPWAEVGAGEAAGDRSDAASGVASSGGSKASLGSAAAKKPPFEIHLLVVGEESVIANGANKVGAEAAEAVEATSAAAHAAFNALARALL